MRLVSLVASFKIKCSSFGLFERGFLFYLNIVYEIAGPNEAGKFSSKF